MSRTDYRENEEWIKGLPSLDFRGVMTEMFYNWQLLSSMPHHHLSRGEDEDGPYVTIDKLTITPKWASYKMENWRLEDGVWDKLVAWLDFTLPLLGPPPVAEEWKHLL